MLMVAYNKEQGNWRKLEKKSFFFLKNIFIIFKSDYSKLVVWLSLTLSQKC